MDNNKNYAFAGLGMSETNFSSLSFITDLAFVALLKEDKTIQDDYKKTGIVNIEVIYNALDKATQEKPITVVSRVIGEITLTNSNIKNLYKCLKDIKIKEPPKPNLFHKMI